MGRRSLLPALCGGGWVVATRVRRVQRASPSRHPSASSKLNKLPAAAESVTTTEGSNKAAIVVKSPGGGGCYVSGDNGALMTMVEVAGGGNKQKDGGGSGRRVMVVADGRKKEAAGALQWALAQAVRSDDTVVLLSVVKPVVAQRAVSDSCVKMLGPKCTRHVEAMKSICQSTRPEVKVETCVVEGEERAPAVVEAARRHGASLLVLGQRRRLRVTRWLLQALLWRRRRGRHGGKGMVDYCIEHAPCVALGVRRRSSGGYLVSSKRHKDFWLLA